MCLCIINALETLSHVKRGIFNFVPNRAIKKPAPQQYNEKFMNRRYTVRIVSTVTGNKEHETKMLFFL